VNTEDGQQFPHESDQFMPSATAAVIHGEVHILALWYDDRRLATPGPADPQPDGPATAHPKFDVFYADITFLPDGTPDIANHELVGTDPDIHALDYELFTLGPWGPGDRPGDYNGIAVRNNVAYTSFFGTNPEDVPLNDNPSTIWSSRIPFAP
jgi:hypothetical protein